LGQQEESRAGGDARIGHGMTEGDAEGDEGKPGAPSDSVLASGRIHANKHRDAQLARTGGRKLFDDAAREVFLEWFAATCNLSWSAELAGFCHKTVLRHRMNDPDFAEAFDRALEQGYARLEAKRLETKRQPLAEGIEGDWEPPDMPEMDPERMDAILRERGRQLAAIAAGGGRRRQGRAPRVASNAEVREALVGRLAAFRARIRARGRKPRGKRDQVPSIGSGTRPRSGEES
jgi:hypothetical protein